MEKSFLFSFYLCFLISCNDSRFYSSDEINDKIQVECNSRFCAGKYIGAEFEKGSDVAHQFSNKMSKAVGDKLKDLYKSKNYCKVDFEKLTMSTEGMGSGEVEYKLYIPFEKVKDKCDAYTSFDHVGGWNHSPALTNRKKQLSSLLLPNNELYISDLKTTKEGLQEYWIQWKNKELQVDCK